MSIEDENIVDIVGIDKSQPTVVLTISDHLDWSDSIHHQKVLQSKLNRYLAFVESGELLESYPAAKGLGVRFSVVFKFRPDPAGEEFLKRATAVIESAGFAISTEVFAESYNN